MSERFNQLSGRHRALRELSARQREQLSQAAGEVGQALEPVDRGVHALRTLARHPALIIGGAALLAFIGPKRIFSLAARSALWLPAAREVLRLATKRRTL